MPPRPSVALPLAHQRGVRLASCILLVLLAVFNPLGAAFASDTSAQKLLDTSDGRDWAAYGRTFGEQHFSPLAQVNSQNVTHLGLAWFMDLAQENSTTTPIAVDGILYFATGYSVVHAVDGATGKLLWSYDPKAATAAAKNLRMGWGSRGIAWWNDKIYTGTQDGRLIALDAKTGRPVWSVRTFDPTSPRYISGAPRAFDGKIAIGNAGDIGAVRGYVTTYDAETGKQLWRFYTVPGNPTDGFENDAMARAAKTWSGEWWKFGGNGTVWNAMSYDQETNTLYIDTGNAYPYLPETRTENRGDNLYTCSVIALDANTGAYKWHYQFVPRDAWDYDSVMDMALANLSISGQPRKVLITAPKNGFLYVIDRITGRLISAEPFAKVTWASRIDLSTGRPVENPVARYPTGSTADVWPSAYGAHNWLPMAFSPTSRLVYIPVIEQGMLVSEAKPNPLNWRTPADRTTDTTVTLQLELENAKGRLLAWDPVTQTPAWSVPQPSFETGGVLATAGGLVFQGAIDGRFSAYSDSTGALIWSLAQDTPIVAPPISYSVNNRQYITVLTGLGTSFSVYSSTLAKYHIDPRSQSRRVLSFSLDGAASLPAPNVPAPLASDTDFQENEKSTAAGSSTYVRHCVICHGISAVGAGHAPDLRRSSIPLSPVAFARVVRDCIDVEKGMPCFGEFTDDQLNDLRQYLRTENRKSRSATVAH